MNSKLIICLILPPIFLHAGEEPDATRFWMGFATKNLVTATKTLKQVVDEVPEVANTAGGEFIKGAITELAKNDKAVQALGGNLAKGAMAELTSPQRQQLAYDLIKGGAEGLGAAATGAVVVGAKAASAKVTAGVVGAKVAVVTKASAAAAGTKATIAAGLASPAAPFVIGTLVVGGGVAGGTYGAYKYRETNFRRCINRNFGGQLNAEGFPERFESPERRLAWWSKYTSDEIVGRYKVEREGCLAKGAQRTE